MRIIDSDSFEMAVSSENGVLVDFFAAWCGPCRTMSKVLEDIEPQQWDICKVDIDASPDLAQKYKVTSVPTLIFFKSGHELVRSSGAANKKAMLQMVQQALDHGEK